MTAIASFQKIYNLDEYLAVEERSVDKHEFDNGKRIPMAGGTGDHAKIAMNFGAFLNVALLALGKEFSIFNSDIRVFMPLLRKAVYPDMACVLGAEAYFDTKRTLLTNPKLIVEVLSESTADYDRGEKFDNYRSLPSFEEYVLVSQAEPTVEVYYLQDRENELWKISRASGMEASIQLRSVGCTLLLKDIFRNIEFPMPTAEPTDD